ncbi:MAG: hypothetical protein C0483_19270 [Pirellula sp.]|nr:hypothetical protein [Pirellula sp.]
MSGTSCASAAVTEVKRIDAKRIDACARNNENDDVRRARCATGPFDSEAEVRVVRPSMDHT